MQIRHLANCPAAIPQIARWLYDEWGRLFPGASVERGISRLQERFHRDRVPFTLIAVEGEAVIGTVSLIDCDMDTRSDLSPWLASLYVLPDQRRRGIGAALVEAVVFEAKRLGIDTLFLFTDSSEALYARLGWQKVESCIYKERAVVIMRKHVA
jgi:N-acetylglutamate synthase-like GNAT family acetyltransferase